MFACATPEPFCYYLRELAPTVPMILLFGGHLECLPPPWFWFPDWLRGLAQGGSAVLVAENALLSTVLEHMLGIFVPGVPATALYLAELSREVTAGSSVLIFPAHQWAGTYNGYTFVNVANTIAEENGLPYRVESMSSIAFAPNLRDGHGSTWSAAEDVGFLLLCIS